MADDPDDKRRSPHDRLARRILSDPEAAAVELRHVLPKAIAEQLDLDDIRIEPTSFVDPTLDEGRSDILYSIAIKGTDKRVLVYVLLEHQSQPDRLMPWRVLEYLVWFWERYIANHRGPVRTLPFVIPVVLAQCEHGWTAPYRLSELFDLPDELREVFGSPVEVSLLVDEIDERVVQDQRARDEILAVVRLMRLLMLAHHHGDRFTEDQVLMAAALFEEVTRQPGTKVVRTLWFYVASVFGPQSRFRDMLLEAIDEEQRRMYDAAKVEWLEEYQAEWLQTHGAKLQADAEAKGEARGRATAKAELIVELLEQRGFPLSPTIRDRVLSTADELQLQRWFERAIGASTLDEVFVLAR